ncbi:MAG: putative replicase protein [Gulmivirus nemorisadaptatum]|uniref:RNA-directed RNA polymerase n=1 Tax=Leviviridae sp. TaxID=2027243 RepID=A0ABY3SUP6_9VIRU|nr:MAG: putative replicase protein [Leviviridae sp.]
MTKSLEFDFLGLYDAILKDVVAYFPNDRKSVERDFTRLTLLHRTRGMPTFTMDLPALGKLLDKSLAKGLLDLEHANLSYRRRPGSRIPRLFQGLWLRLFDDYGSLKADIDPNAVFFLRTLLYCGKNLEWDCAPRYLYEATKEFFDIEAQIPPPSSFWDDGVGVPSDHSLPHLHDLVGQDLGSGLFPSRDQAYEPLLDAIQRSADRISGLIGIFCADDVRFRHGPGSVSDLRSGSYKYRFPSWSPRLDTHFPYDRYGITGFDLMDRLQPDGLEYASLEGHSKLIAVPKTQKGPRLIASEPTANQWIQQGVRDFLYRRVAETPISLSLTFESQEPNQRLARVGSEDGAFATVDLKSASDRLSCYVVERVFRKNQPLLEVFAACRTRYMSNDIDHKRPSLIKLRKFTTQGSALTFPVQSLVFLAVVLGVGRYLEPRSSYEELSRRVRVFGDDIVLPNSWEPLATKALSLLGLKVNQTKTFSEGNFRESCGMDAWRGHDVTPPHVTMKAIESDARTVASNVAVSNNFHKKGLWNAADWVRSTIRLGQKILVVGQSSGVFGFTSFGPAPIPSSIRWNEGLHRDEARALVVVAKAKRVKQDTAASLLQYFTEEPDPYVKYESGVAVAGVPGYRSAWVPITELG